MSRIPNYFFEKKSQRAEKPYGREVDYDDVVYEVVQNNKTILEGNEKHVIEFFNNLPMSFVKAIAESGYSIRKSPWNYM